MDFQSSYNGIISHCTTLNNKMISQNGSIFQFKNFIQTVLHY